MHKRWGSLISGRKGAQTVEYVIILVAIALLAGLLYNFLSGGELQQTLKSKIEQIIAGNVDGGKIPESGKQPEPKPQPKPTKKPEPKKEDKPLWKKVIDNPYVKEGTEFVLDSVPVVSNIKSGYEAVTGKDIYGNKLSKTDRAIAATGVFFPGAKHVKRGVKVADKGLDLVKGAKKNKRVKRKGCTKDPKNELCGRGTKIQGKIDYGSTDLSKKAQEYRKRENMFSGRNVAVYEYVDNDGKLQTVAMASERGKGHSERLIAKELEKKGVNPSQVTRIYSELEPCSVPGGYCKRFLKNNFPQADVTYSFDYGDTKESRRKGVSELKKAVRKIK